MVVRASLLVVVVAANAGCLGMQSAIVVPSCVERVEITGEHKRVTDERYVFTHGLDLPFSRTDLVVEKRDGTQETVRVWNTWPDLVRVLGATLVGGVSILVIGLYGYQVGVLGDDPLSPVAWALPLGAGGLALAAALVLTGWHPGEDTRLETPCAG